MKGWDQAWMPSFPHPASKGPGLFPGMGTSPTMTLQGSQRRDLRRRMIQSGHSSASQEGDAPARTHRATAYASAARPENHPALATLLPTRPLRFLAACVAIALVVAAVAAIGSTIHGMLPADKAGNANAWARTARTSRELLGIFSRSSLPSWFGQMLLIASAGVAMSVRQMRRHRLDDYQGRYRAWGWMAVLAVMAAAERQMPLSSFVSAVLSDATGLVLGPEGMGWWLGVSATACLAVALWAVVPLTDRLGTFLTLSLVAAGWMASAAFDWFGGGVLWMDLTARCLGLAGDGLLLISMLVAARTVLREVRGEIGRSGRSRDASRAEKAKSSGHGKGSREQAASDEKSASPVLQHPAATSSSGQWSDGSDGEEEESDEWGEGEGRRLSKSEKKRLRKMARMNRAA